MIKQTKQQKDLTEKLIALAKAYTRLMDEEGDLDYRLSEWCSKARACFTEDHRFIAWMKSDLGINDAVAQDRALRALAYNVVKDKAVWTRLRGFREIRSIEVLPTRRERVEVLEAAKVTGKPVRSIVRERMQVVQPAASKPDIQPLKAPANMKDVERLARFIADHEARLGRLPPEVETIVRMYFPASRRAVA